jgi:resuscitation-promoting factor RpfB
MRLYHSHFDDGFIARFIWRIFSSSFFILKKGILLALIFLFGCTPLQPQAQSELSVVVQADGVEINVRLNPGSTGRDAYAAARVTPGLLDRSEPPMHILLTDGANLRLVRIVEEFEVVEVVVPYERQLLRNETLPEGETRLVQPGVNGLQEITYRRLFEDGVEISNSPVKYVVLEEAVPEILMVGGQSLFSTFPIPGRLAYMLGGNAWLIDQNTANRRPVVTTGDLDGRIFSLSPDGEWLLFTRHAPPDDENINQLWAARMGRDGGETELVDLNVINVIHFADWRPGSTYTIAYSTVEPRSSAPGWQANNDLQMVSLGTSGQVRSLPVELETNMGGTYGWWGMTFAWAPDGSQLAYSRPDSVGLLQRGSNEIEPLLEIVPLQTRSDWAWTPGLSWGPDGSLLFTVDHVYQPGAISPEESPFFDLTAIPLGAGGPLRIVSQVGMFSYPIISPIQPKPDGEQAYQVAFLQSIFPLQSETSRYHLMLMDRDGSNKRVLFPVEGAPGLSPLKDWGVWSPAPLDDTRSHVLALIYQDNLWFVDTATGSARQITGDGLVSRIDWK